MAYDYNAWSVVFGEQPTASKWNYLGTNDASFDERIGADFSSGTTSPIWWEELARTTLGSAGDTIDSGTIGSRKYLMVLIDILSTGGTTVAGLRFNSDTGNNYAFRYSTDGGADTATGTTSIIALSSGTNGNKFATAYIRNVSGQEKLAHGMTTSNNAAGVGNVADRWEAAGKWVNTSTAITSVQAYNSGAGDFDTGSQIIVLGHD